MVVFFPRLLSLKHKRKSVFKKEGFNNSSIRLSHSLKMKAEKRLVSYLWGGSLLAGASDGSCTCQGEDALERA